MKISLKSFLFVLLVPSHALALKSAQRKLLFNGDVIYQDKRDKAEIFGRFRTNFFSWDWENENHSNKDHQASGVGGSVIFRSARRSAWASTIGLYTSQNPNFLRENKQDISHVKAGKDSFDRNKIRNGGDFKGSWGITTLAQAQISYQKEKHQLVFGRQIINSAFTQANDTKMIPNSFDGLSWDYLHSSKLSFKVAALFAQKLRDHTDSHDVIAYKQWRENDDAGVNKSLSTDRIGENNRLYISQIDYRDNNWHSRFALAQVDTIYQLYFLESGHRFKLENFSLTPTFRVMAQRDQLDQNFKRANLNNSHIGYQDANSLNTELWAFRIDLKKKKLLARLAYSQVSDKADVVAPWRGFPTGGFTRAMGQYNWQANTKSTMLQLRYQLSSAQVMQIRYVWQDNDNAKPGVPADQKVVNLDLGQNIGKSWSIKLRGLYVKSENDIIDQQGNLKADNSYREYRLETNYFF